MAKIPRKNKGKYSEDYLTDIMLRDFLGQLKDHEVEIAKETGLLKWDLWCKARQIVPWEPKFAQKEYGLAPVLDGYGNIDDKQRYGKKAYFINSHEELAKFQAENEKNIIFKQKSINER